MKTFLKNNGVILFYIFTNHVQLNNNLAGFLYQFLCLVRCDIPYHVCNLWKTLYL